MIVRLQGVFAPLKAVVSQKELLAVCITTVITMMGQGIISPVLPLFVKSLGVTATLIGVVIGVFGFGRLVMNLPTGYLVEKIGRRPVLVAGPTVIAVATLAMAFTTNYPMLLVLRFVQGLGSGMYMTAAMIYLTDIAGPGQRGRYLSYQQGSLLTGNAVGPAVGGIVAEAFGLHAPFYLLAALCALAALWAGTQVREPVRKPAVARPPAPVRADGTVGKQRSGVLQLLMDPSFVVVGLFGMAVFTNRAGGRQSILPLFAADKGLGPAQIGWLFSFGVIAQLITVVIAGGLSDRFGRKRSIVPSALISVVGTMLFVISGSYWAMIGCMMLIMFGEGISGPAPVAFAADIAQGKGLGGLGVGLYRTFGDLGFVLGPILSGLIADAFGMGWGLMAGQILLVIAAALLWFVAKEPAREVVPAPATPAPAPSR